MASYGGFGGGGDYSTTSYGAQGGAGGGGYMEGSQFGASQKQAKQYDKETLRPCTILQLRSAEKEDSDNFNVDGVKLDQVKVIGQVRSIAKQATGVYYTLDDGTGTIEGRTLNPRDTHDENGEPLPLLPGQVTFEVGQWAKIYGKLKQHGDQSRRSVFLDGMKKVEDMNEINYHLLECTAMHLLNTRGPPGGADTAMKQDDGGLFVSNNDPGRRTAGLSANAQKVFAFLQKQEVSGEGFHAQMISSSTHIPFNDVLQAGEELHTASLIYETVDEHTWAVLE